MKLLHISDLHIGKKLREMDITDDQIYILNEIIQIADREKPDGILIAGDVYDRSVPPANAVNIFNHFLTELEKRGLKIFIISGNHDSPERLNYGKDILGKNYVYIAGTFNGNMERITLSDEYGPIHIHLLPFIKPSVVSYFYKEEESEAVEIDSYEKACKIVVDAANVDVNERNILLAHQFVTNHGMEPERSDSEAINVGGLDNIDVSCFDVFDYVALGHIHRPQKVGRETVRYCGTPLKYSFSECNHKKSVTIIEIKEKNNITISKTPLIPLKDMRIIKDTLDNLLHDEKYTSQNREDYIYAIITDEKDIYDPIGQLRSVYKNVLLLEVENAKTKFSENEERMSLEVTGKTPFAIFEEFYKNQNNAEMTKEQQSVLYEIFEELGGSIG